MSKRTRAKSISRAYRRKNGVLVSDYELGHRVRATGKPENVPLCQVGPGGLIPDAKQDPTRELYEDGGAFRARDPDSEKETAMVIRDKIARSQRHSQQEILRYWASREHGGDLARALEARKRLHPYQGAQMQPKAFLDGLNWDAEEHADKLRAKHQKRDESRRERMRVQQERKFSKLLKQALIDDGVKPNALAGVSLPSMINFAKVRGIL